MDRDEITLILLRRIIVMYFDLNSHKNAIFAAMERLHNRCTVLISYDSDAIQLSFKFQHLDRYYYTHSV